MGGLDAIFAEYSRRGGGSKIERKQGLSDPLRIPCDLAQLVIMYTPSEVEQPRNRLNAQR